MESKMYCSYCHTKLFDSDRTCPSCGAPTNNTINKIENDIPVYKEVFDKPIRTLTHNGIKIEKIEEDEPEHIIQLRKEIANIQSMNLLMRDFDYMEYCKKTDLESKQELLNDYLYTKKYKPNNWTW